MTYRFPIISEQLARSAAWKTMTQAVVLTMLAAGVACTADVDSQDLAFEDEAADTSEQAILGAPIRVHVTAPNNASYSNLDNALEGWDDWICAMGASARTAAVHKRFAQEQAKVKKGTKIYWSIYSHYVSAGNHCSAWYALDFSTRRVYPAVIPLDPYRRPLAENMLGTMEGTK